LKLILAIRIFFTTSS